MDHGTRTAGRGRGIRDTAHASRTRGDRACLNRIRASRTFTSPTCADRGCGDRTGADCARARCTARHDDPS